MIYEDGDRERERYGRSKKVTLASFHEETRISRTWEFLFVCISSKSTSLGQWLWSRTHARTKAPLGISAAFVAYSRCRSFLRVFSHTFEPLWTFPSAETETELLQCLFPFCMLHCKLLWFHLGLGHIQSEETDTVIWLIALSAPFEKLDNKIN